MTFIVGAIVFTDIVGSSTLWKNHPKNMKNAVYSHDKMISKIVKKYKGSVVKTMGDSFMIYLKGEHGYEKGIKIAFDIQYSLNNKPIIVDKKSDSKIILRIGLAQGPMNIHRVRFQGKRLRDYFGTTVNLASRMESKVSKPNTISFCFWETEIPHEYINELSKQFDIIVKDYRDYCIPSNNIKCENSELLHGVPGVLTFTIV